MSDATIDATIIAASLNSEELEKSINDLVGKVKQGMSDIKSAVHGAVGDMQQTLQGLGSIRVDSGGASDGGSSRRTKALREETQSTQQLTESYDKLAEAQQKAVGTKSARESFYAFAQGFKERGEQIAQQIKSAEEALNRSIESRVSDLNAKIANAKAKLNELYVQLERESEKARQGGTLGNQFNANVSRIQQNIEYTKKHIEELNREVANAPNTFGAQVQQIEQLRAQYEKVANTMRDSGNTERQNEQVRQQSVSTASSLLSEEQKRTSELKKQADEIRNSKQYQEKGFYQLTIGGSDYVIDSKSKLSIEERLLEIERQVARQQEIQAEYESRIKFETQGGLDVAQQQLNVERQITEEKSKRKYETPTSSQTDITPNKMATFLSQQLNDEKTRIVRWDEETDSILRLQKALRQYQDAYANMSATMRRSPYGRQMVADMQVLENAIRNARREMSRPLNLASILSQPANTIDQLTDKIRQLETYKRGLNFETQKQEIKDVDKALKDTRDRLNEYMSTGRSVGELNKALARSWNYMKNRLAFYFTVGASTQFLKQLVEIRGQYELLERSIGILVDSAQKGSQIFSELNAMAIKSPFTTMELGNAARQLVAYGVAAKDVVDTTRRIADIAAAVGAPVERLTYALAHVQTYGYLTSLQARQFSNAGVPVVKELADMYTQLEGRMVSVSDVYDRMKKKAVSYNDVMQVVYKMTDEGGRFFNFQEKAADTLKVKIANLTLAWNNMLNEIGKSEQGTISGALNITKEIFQNWRNILNTLNAILLVFGTMKAIQIARLILLQKELTLTRLIAILRETTTKGFANGVAALAQGLKNLANPTTALVALIAALSVALVKATMDYYDLQQANKAFNKSIVDGAKENIDSIEKFFNDYKKELNNISGASPKDQQKLWERLQEEIEKTTKNAQQYIDTLKDIPTLPERISAGESVLEQTQEIEKEAKRLAERGFFDLGGGFADDSLAKNLQETTEWANKLLEVYGSLDEARQNLSKSSYATTWSNYRESLKETENELNKFVGVLDKANIEKIMGDDPDTQLANLREFAYIIRDNFLATEEGQKVTMDGQARLNNALDQWVAKQGVANGIIIADNVAAIEASRSAWEDFFDQLSKSDKERLDYLIETNQTGSEEFDELWQKAAKNMADNATTSYELIKDQIQQLRLAPAIVIDVIYRSRVEQPTDAQIEAYTNRYLKPKNASVLSLDAYFEKLEENMTKYGRFIKKEGEDNVEWEKRLGEQYQANEKSIESLNAQLENSAALRDVDRKAKEDELEKLKDEQEALDEIRAAQNFNYEQFKKRQKSGKGSKKDPVLDALKEEIRLVEKLQSDYDKLSKAGAASSEALATIQGAYGNTIKQLNANLGGMGLPELTTQLITGKDPHKSLEHFKKTLESLVSSGMITFDRAKEVEGVIEKLTISVKTYDLEKVTKGLNNELDKIKDEYELAVELDADPELGSMFTQMFGIDTADFPKTIDEYMKRAQQEFDKMRKKRNFSAPLNIFKAGDKEWEEWGRQVGLVVDVLDENGNVIDKNTDALDKLTPKFKEAQGVAKKWAQDVVNNTKKLEYELAELDDKIAIEQKKLANLERQFAQETNEDQKRLLKLQIQQQKNAIAKLKEGILELLPTYKRVFGEVAEHSTWMTRKLIRNYKDMLLAAQERGKNENGKYTIIDPISGEQAEITEEKLGREISKANKELAKTDNIFKKIKEDMTKGKDGVIDWVKGIEDIGHAIGQVGDLVDEIGNVYDMFGNPNEYNATSEAIHDIATTMHGVDTAAEGIEKIAGGDFLGGAVSVISGVSSAINTWFDNSDKKISAQVKSSELAVKRLENAYKELQYAIEKAYGESVYGAEQLAIANKKLQLQELKHQLILEEQRDSKHYDADRVLELRGQIIDLENEIANATDDIVNHLLGITSVGDAAENVAQQMLEAFKNGEDYMESFDKSFSDMIDSMIAKAVATRVIADRIQQVFDYVDKQVAQKGSGIYDIYGKEVTLGAAIAYYEQGIKKLESTGYNRNSSPKIAQFYKTYENLLAMQRESYVEAIQQGTTVIANAKEGAEEDFLAMMDALGVKYGESSADKKLSALQQGIQGITEETAGALEAYMNGVSQQVYLHSDLLTQIRDAVVGFDMDVQLGVVSQILLQLQSSYQVQMSIQTILSGWSNPSGMAVRVEMV